MLILTTSIYFQNQEHISQFQCSHKISFFLSQCDLDLLQLSMSQNIILFSIFLLLRTQSVDIHIDNKEVLPDSADFQIITNNQLNQSFNDTTFQSEINCKNGGLNIVNTSYFSYMVIVFKDIEITNTSDIIITTSPNKGLTPFVENLSPPLNSFEINFNCSVTLNDDNYWNKISVIILQKYKFSFLLNCDITNHHKKFETGYLIIAVIDAAIIIGVAMHSYIWSIRINLRPLRFRLRWIPFLIFSVSLSAFVVVISFVTTTEDYTQAFSWTGYGGVVCSIFFVFICWNQTLFLFKALRKPLFWVVRWCDIISGMLTIGMITYSFFDDNLILYGVLAACICIGSIKLFYFESLKQAFLSMTISVIGITILSSILHFILPRSYNDYAGQLASPLFIQVPDMVNNLYKKCSWLPVLDIILPGVTLSYLRIYDKNKSSTFLGVYTIFGNLSFVCSTVIWIGIQYVYPYNVPFSLVTYPILILTIFIIAWRRNDWYTLLRGRFLKEIDNIDPSSLDQKRKSFRQYVDSGEIKQWLIDGNQASASIITD